MIRIQKINYCSTSVFRNKIKNVRNVCSCTNLYHCENLFEPLKVFLCSQFLTVIWYWLKYTKRRRRTNHETDNIELISVFAFWNSIGKKLIRFTLLTSLPTIYTKVGHATLLWYNRVTRYYIPIIYSLYTQANIPRHLSPYKCLISLLAWWKSRCIMPVDDNFSQRFYESMSPAAADPISRTVPFNSQQRLH